MGHLVWCSLVIINMRGLCLACILLVGSVAAQTTEITPESNNEETTTITTSTITTSTTTTTTEATSTTSTEAPVVITKQINEINEDGSYTVGYEASDGTFKLETKDVEGNVEGKYGYLDENGEIKVVEYSANNSTGFTSDLELPEQAAAPVAGEAPVQEDDPAFALEKQRHEAVLAFQKSVIEKQEQIARQNDASAQRQNFASNRQGARRPVFNAANFNPSRPASEQFNTQNFNQDFRDSQQQQQFQQQPQQQQQFFQQPQQQFQPRQQFQQPPQQQFQPQQSLQPAFQPQQQQAFRTPQPVGPSPVAPQQQQQQFTQAQLQQLFAQQQQQLF